MINLKEDWLDNVTEEQLRGFFEHSKLAKIKELRSVKIIQDDEGNKRVFFNYDAYSRTMDTNEIAVFDAFGQITPYQRQYHDARTVKDLDSIVNDEDLINWHLMVSSANRGRVIDGKTYDEAFIEYYQDIINTGYKKVIDDFQTQMVSYINQKIQTNHALRLMVEGNANIGEMAD